MGVQHCYPGSILTELEIDHVDHVAICCGACCVLLSHFAVMLCTQGMRKELPAVHCGSLF